jgi:hypothetical protein
MCALSDIHLNSVLQSATREDCNQIGIPMPQTGVADQ